MRNRRDDVTAPIYKRLLVCACSALLAIVICFSLVSSLTDFHQSLIRPAESPGVDHVTFSGGNRNNTTSPEPWSSPRNLTDGLTVVTAFFNIGPFQKGNGGRQFTSRLYRDWARVFSRLESPTVIFVDCEEFRRYFAELRALHLRANLTVIRLLDRQQMWSFQLVPSIAKIFSRPHYPYHTPNTVVPAYSAAMHAKYEVMELAIRSNPFNTRYFCWLDVGLFRDLAHSGVNGSRFALSLPPKFDVGSVAYTEVSRRDRKLSVEEIVSLNKHWVCGCFFVGRLDRLLTLVHDYKAATERMLRDGWMSTDQQVLYAMYNTMNTSTRLQLYHSDGRFNEWFHLGYLAREAGTTAAAST